MKYVLFIVSNMATKEENNEKQEPQICFKLNDTGNTIQIPVSKFNTLLTKKLKKKMEDLKVDTTGGYNEFMKFLNLESFETKNKLLKIEVEQLKNVCERLKRDLKHDKFAQPVRPAFGLTSQNILIKKK